MTVNRVILYSLRVFFALILLAMLTVTIIASLYQNIFEGVGQIWPNWWFKVTLADAYFGFLTFFVWVAYKELHLWRQLAWFISIMLLGNFAIAAYVLIELSKLQAGDSVETLLTNRNG
jgi:hypothetical protein